MVSLTSRKASARALRQELAARNALRGSTVPHEVAFGSVQSIVYAPDAMGGHGNFLRASFRRIVRDPDWASRLGKSYTGAAYLPHAGSRWRGELECASSSDALLMNVFCYPGILRRTGVCVQLGVEAGLRPAFGVRAALPMQNGEVDRTELDMRVGQGCGQLLVEAKLTEGGFGRASRQRLLRYVGVREAFHISELPQTGEQFSGYQIIRGVLAAQQSQSRYLVLLDARRGDLQEICFRVLRAARTSEAASRFRLLSWQELAKDLPRSVQTFLAEKYGIEPTSSASLTRSAGALLGA